MRENADQNNSEYGHFSRSVTVFIKRSILNVWQGSGYAAVIQRDLSEIL